MLNKLKLFFWLIIIFAVAYFVSVNTEPEVSVKILPNYTISQVPMALVAVTGMVVGAFIVLIFTVIDWFSYKMEKRRLNKQIEHLKEELKKCQENLTIKEEEEDGTIRQGLHEGESNPKEPKQPPSEEK
jgi:uncharacterized integral membrane protein